MTPAHTDSPLRRSEAHGAAGGVVAVVAINDDEEERREARRRTLLSRSVAGSNNENTTSIEDNETLQKCLEIYNGNKLSRENAWSLSLIDTLSTLLERHHKSLNNFKVAGSSLEASSKVYGLRVDSIHTDVLRMSAGLNAQKFNERDLEMDDDDDDDGVATGGDGAADPNSSAGGANAAEKAPAAPKPKPKRQRKAVSTITKNKDTLNARLDTVPLQDPVFGKLNSIVGSINSSTRLMNNILPTADSELRLRTTFRFWDARALGAEQCDYTEELSMDTAAESTDESQLAACDRLFRVQRYEELQLRPLHSGYVISDTPDPVADDKDPRRMSLESTFGGGGALGGGDADAPHDADAGSQDNGVDGAGGVGDGGVFHNPSEMSMAFDINAECEPLPALSEHTHMVDVDFGDFDDLTTEERTAINNCRGLRKAPVLIEDLRPVDASSKLEYSYRPLDKISQFWAGPSHWKFKRTRPRNTLHAQQSGVDGAGVSGARDNNTAAARSARNRRAQLAAAKKQRSKLNFGQFHDELFIPLDNKFKARRANVQKKWDQRKLKLPTDVQFDPLSFFRYNFAPGLKLPGEGGDDDDQQRTMVPNVDDDTLPTAMDNHFGDDDDADGMRGSCGGANLMAVSSLGLNTSAMGGEGTAGASVLAADADLLSGLGDDGMDHNNTVLEIATEFEGAPRQVTKIIVPFAKRAKVIDMKNLKRCCTQLLTKQMKRPIDTDAIPTHPVPKQEQYSLGMASFQEIYDHLPELLTQTMADSLSPSVAFYSVLHLANDYNLRLIPQEDLGDFKIRQVLE